MDYYIKITDIVLSLTATIMIGLMHKNHGKISIMIRNNKAVTELNATMKAIFFINPMIVRGNPSFYAGAIDKKLIPQANCLIKQGWEVSFIINEFYVDLIHKSIPHANCIIISQTEIVQCFGSTQNLEQALYEGDKGIIKKYKKLISAKIDFSPDFFILWETEGHFLKEIYKNAIIIHEMPGFLSRVPFPELFILDINGLFKDSSITQTDILERNKPDWRAKILLSNIRSELVNYIDEMMPFSREDLDPLNRYQKILLLPLQVTDQYAFKADSGYTSQIALLIDVITQIPKNWGIVITQYTAGKTQRELSKDTIEALKSKYDNLIYLDDFERIDSISQYLIPIVDAIVTISSSIGLQALLWNKPLIAINSPYFQQISNYKSLNQYVSNVLSNISFDDGMVDYYLEWIFTYHQPLASLLIRDRDFLTKWLIEVQKCISNGNGLPNIFDLFEDYGSKFMALSKKAQSALQIELAYGQNRSKKLENDFSAFLNKNNPSIISFDIFDTLLDRLCEQPNHIFNLMESDVYKISNGKLSDFFNIRTFAETNVRNNAQNNGIFEISIDDIYEYIGRTYNITKKQILKIKELEIATEEKYLCKREVGWLLYEIAKKRNKRIIFISDMYLPKSFIEKILLKFGYDSYDNFYLSCEEGVRKHDGQLFEMVQKKEAIKFKEWVHVGDNKIGDFKIPASYGICCFLLERASINISQNKKFGELIKVDKKNRTIAETFIYGLIQKRFFDNPCNLVPIDTHFGGKPNVLGYIGLGPLFFGFLQWVMISAVRDGIENLIFLSRDGEILYKMANILFPISQNWPKRSYALSSRRAARIASIYTNADISHLINSSIYTGTTLNKLFSGKFGIDLDDSDLELVKKYGFSSINSRIEISKHRDSLHSLALVLSDRILQNSLQERKLLAEYYENLGVCGQKTALVDIGYAATMQAAISKMTGNYNLAGYYYITFDSALRNVSLTGAINGYAGNFVKPHINPNPICRNGFLYETVFCSSADSFIGFAVDGSGKTIGRFDIDNNSMDRRKLINEIHEGVVRFARDMSFLERPLLLNSMIMEPLISSRIFVDFISMPSGRDAAIFEGIQFDDNFAGAEKRYIVPPREYIKQDENIVSKAIWKEGTAVFSRRPDIFTPNNAVQKPLEKSNVLATQQGNIQAANKEAIKQESILTNIEKKIVTYAVNEKKQNKYTKNRKSFFLDSKSKVVKLYWKVIGKKL